MTLWKTTLAAGLLAATALAAPAIAGGTLRLDEVAVGELDPAKASDYADSILMFNVYDTLVLPVQGGPGHAPHLAESWDSDGNSFTFKLRSDVNFQSGNPLTAEDVVFSVERMKALGAGLSYLLGVVESAEADRFLDRPLQPFLLLRAVRGIAGATAHRRQEAGHGKPRRGRRRDEGLGTGLPVRKRRRHRGLSGRLAQPAGRDRHGEERRDYFLDMAGAAPDTVRLRYGLEASTVRTLIALGASTTSRPSGCRPR